MIQNVLSIKNFNEIILLELGKSERRYLWSILSKFFSKKNSLYRFIFNQIELPNNNNNDNSKINIQNKSDSYCELPSMGKLILNKYFDNKKLKMNQKNCLNTKNLTECLKDSYLKRIERKNDSINPDRKSNKIISDNYPFNLKEKFGPKVYEFYASSDDSDSSENEDELLMKIFLQQESNDLATDNENCSNETNFESTELKEQTPVEITSNEMNSATFKQNSNQTKINEKNNSFKGFYISNITMKYFDLINKIKKNDQISKAEKYMLLESVGKLLDKSEQQGYESNDYDELENIFNLNNSLKRKSPPSNSSSSSDIDNEDNEDEKKDEAVLKKSNPIPIMSFSGTTKIRYKLDDNLPPIDLELNLPELKDIEETETDSEDMEEKEISSENEHNEKTGTSSDNENIEDEEHLDFAFFNLF